MVLTAGLRRWGIQYVALVKVVKFGQVRICLK